MTHRIWFGLIQLVTGNDSLRAWAREWQAAANSQDFGEAASEHLDYWIRHTARSHERARWATPDMDPDFLQAVESLDLSPGRVLDLGCGLGTQPMELAARGWDAVGIDIAPQLVRRAIPQRVALASEVYDEVVRREPEAGLVVAKAREQRNAAAGRLRLDDLPTLPCHLGRYRIHRR